MGDREKAINGNNCRCEINPKMFGGWHISNYKVICNGCGLPRSNSGEVRQNQKSNEIKTFAYIEEYDGALFVKAHNVEGSLGIGFVNKRAAQEFLFEINSAALLFAYAYRMEGVKENNTVWEARLAEAQAEISDLVDLHLNPESEGAKRAKDRLDDGHPVQYLRAHVMGAVKAALKFVAEQICDARGCEEPMCNKLNEIGDRAKTPCEEANLIGKLVRDLSSKIEKGEVKVK